MGITREQDAYFMSQALMLAEQGLGRVAPNPSVGCVIAKDGMMLAAARTQDGGRPHAEAFACDMAQNAQGATLYVTLEPCAHQGQTPPCVDKIIQSGIIRVVIATLDPNPLVNGTGVKALKAAGIYVDVGLMEQEAKAVNAGFFKVLREEIPYITLKTATSLDAKIATAQGESKWITGEEARDYAHQERGRHDAILVGINTVLADDPLLTVRFAGTSRQPTRIVLDTHLRTPLECKLVTTAKEHATWVFAGATAPAEKRAELENHGVRVVQFAADYAGRVPLEDALKVLAAEGITRLMVEGGAQIITSFLQGGLYDRLVWFRAPIIIGQEGMDAIGKLGIEHLQDVLRFGQKKTMTLGADLIEIYEKGQN